MSTQAELLIKDFRAFMFYVWGRVGLPEPTDIQIDIAQWLMEPYSRKGILAFRGVAKSWITCAFCVWRLLRDPNEKVMIVSAGEGKALENAYFIRRLINELPICSHLAGGERDSIKSFDVKGCNPDPTPSVRTVGITGQMTGGRASLLIADDVEVPNNSYSQLQRGKLAEAIKEFDAILKPNGQIVFLGTPQSEESIYNILRAERGYTFRIWPARIPLASKVACYNGDLAPFIMEKYRQGLAGEWSPTDPTRFSEEELVTREMSYGASGFALQFMLDTSLSDADRFPLKLKDFIVYDFDGTGVPSKIVWSGDRRNFLDDITNPGLNGDGFYRPSFVHDVFSPFESIAMSIDPSGRGKDETAYAIGGQSLGRQWICDVGGLASGSEGYSDEVIDTLLGKARLWKVREIVVENNAGHGMFTKILRSRMNDSSWRCAITEVNQSKQKERRIISTLEPLLNQHKIVINREVLLRDAQTPERDYRLCYQLTRITNARGALAHDDRLDALEMLCSYFEESMARNEHRAHNDLMMDKFWEEEEMFKDSISRVIEIDRSISDSGPLPAPSTYRVRNTFNGVQTR